jgi:hypothetical protein
LTPKITLSASIKGTFFAKPAGQGNRKDSQNGGSRCAPAKMVTRRRSLMVYSNDFQHIVAVLAGILILVAPKLLNYTIALYLILVGVLGLLRI